LAGNWPALLKSPQPLRIVLIILVPNPELLT